MRVCRGKPLPGTKKPAHRCPPPPAPRPGHPGELEGLLALSMEEDGLLEGGELRDERLGVGVELLEVGEHLVRLLLLAVACVGDPRACVRLAHGSQHELLCRLMDGEESPQLVEE